MEVWLLLVVIILVDGELFGVVEVEVLLLDVITVKDVITVVDVTTVVLVVDELVDVIRVLVEVVGNVVVLIVDVEVKEIASIK